MRLIDADELFENVDGLVIEDMEVHRAEVLSLILSAPTIDAEPVVRCRECVSFMGYSPRYEPTCPGVDGDCKMRVMNSNNPYFYAVRKADFCSLGQRKEEST